MIPWNASASAPLSLKILLLFGCLLCSFPFDGSAKEVIRVYYEHAVPCFKNPHSPDTLSKDVPKMHLYTILLRALKGITLRRCKTDYGLLGWASTKCTYGIFPVYRSVRLLIDSFECEPAEACRSFRKYFESEDPNIIRLDYHGYDGTSGNFDSGRSDDQKFEISDFPRMPKTLRLIVREDIKESPRHFKIEFDPDPQSFKKEETRVRGSVWQAAVIEFDPANVLDRQPAEEPVQNK